MSFPPALLLADRPVPISEIPPELRLKIIGAAGAGFPSPAQDWEETAINLVELLRIDRAASFVFEVRGNSMIEAGLYDRDVVVVDRDGRPVNGRIVVAIVRAALSFASSASEMAGCSSNRAIGE